MTALCGAAKLGISPVGILTSYLLRARSGEEKRDVGHRHPTAGVDAHGVHGGLWRG